MRRPARIRSVFPAILAALALPAAAHARAEPSSDWTVTDAQRTERNPIAPTAESTARGGPLYVKNCLACHGTNGDGRGPVATRLGFTAGDLTRKTGMAKKTDGELFWKIATGRDPMPAFRKPKGLTDPQIWDLVNYIRTLAAK